MKVFSVNKGIGYASSGIEYAQKYRKELLEDVDVEDYYIFLDYLATNITVYTDLMNFDRTQVIWIYNYLSHRSNKASTYTSKKFLNNLNDEYEITNQNDNIIQVQLVNKPIRYDLLLLDSGAVDQVRLFNNGQLQKNYHYDNSLNNYEEFVEGQLVRRVFFDEKGNESFQQFYKNGDITVTLIQNQVIYGLSGFMAYFMEQLNITETDVVIIDRPLNVAETLVPILAGKARLFSVVHAEHFSENLSFGDHILWNNNYEYVFDYADSFEAIIVATERQKEVLSKQLKKKTNIVLIPVGYINEINQEDNYQKFNLVTASRLASEKHLDVLIQAVAEVKKSIPQLQLDIFGEGGERSRLSNLITELNADEYIKLKGHKKLDGIYGGYGAYVSASTSEGFGLSLLEATAAGLPIIGADVDYGNREFIVNKSTGILYPYNSLDDLSNDLAKAILYFYSNDMVHSTRPKVRQKAKMYLKEIVADKWARVLGD